MTAYCSDFIGSGGRSKIIYINPPEATSGANNYNNLNYSVSPYVLKVTCKQICRT